MAHTIVIGDGPGGLSAALFLAKNGHEVVVFGEDRTAMHAALLLNYLGIEEMTGSDFQKVARAQVEKHGATLRAEHVESVTKTDGGFSVKPKDGDAVEAKYLVLSEGKAPRLARTLGLEADETGAIPTDKNGLTAVANAYVVGRSARPGRSQAIISAGDGAAAAIDILSREKGEAVVDWDSPPKG